MTCAVVCLDYGLDTRDLSFPPRAFIPELMGIRTLMRCWCSLEKVALWAPWSPPEAASKPGQVLKISSVSLDFPPAGGQYPRCFPICNKEAEGIGKRCRLLRASSQFCSTVLMLGKWNSKTLKAFPCHLIPKYLKLIDIFLSIFQTQYT